MQRILTTEFLTQVEVKHRSSERVVFLVGTRETYAKGDNPLFVFDGEQLFRLSETFERGLRVQTSFVLRLPDGTKVTAEVLLEGFGAPKGMFIVSDYRRIRDHTDAIIAAGFGYTCIPQPSSTEIASLAGVDACLEDWKNETA